MLFAGNCFGIKSEYICMQMIFYYWNSFQESYADYSLKLNIKKSKSLVIETTHIISVRY